MKSIILKPILSEKSLLGSESGKYIFIVNNSANKHEIAEEIGKIYKAKVTKVNIINVAPEDRLVRGRNKSHKKGYKKAVITLEKGKKIEGFEFKE